MLSYNRILTYLIFTASIGCGQNSTTDSTLFQWIESQVELSNIWKWEDALPDFVANPQFQRQYYPDISEFGGLGQVAIIEKISNKNILLRIITGCEKQIDVPVSQSVSLNEINFAENSLFDYYYHKNLRSIAEDRFKRLFTTKNLGENIDSMNVDVSGCDELTARIINGYKHLNSSDRTLIKGFFYTIVTRSGEKGTVVFSSDSIQNNQSDSIFLFEIKRLIDKQLNKARGKYMMLIH